MPVISTDAGGASETIIDGITGHIVYSYDSKDLSEKIISALEDKLWMKTASIKSIEFSRDTFSTSNMIKRLLELYLMPLN